MDKVTVFNRYEILSFLPVPSGSPANIPQFQPHTVRRLSDGETFSIGDRFLMKMEGIKPCGTITGFTMLEEDIYITHDWSGIGFGLSGIQKAQLPSRYQINQVVHFITTLGTYICHATVKGVHFYKAESVKYDLELWDEAETKTRIYNVAEKLLKEA